LKRPNRILTTIIWLILLVLLGYLIISGTMQKKPDVLHFTEFAEKVRANDILALRAVIGENSYSGLYILEEGQEEDEETLQKRINRLPKGADFTMSVSETVFTEDMKHLMAELLDKPKDEVSSSDYSEFFRYITVLPPPESWLLAVLPYAFLGIAIVVVFVIVARQQGGGKQMMNFGKAKPHLQNLGQKKVTFDDVAGVDEEKEELAEIVEFLREPERFDKLGARIPKGVLLVGPPGTGKTLMARAVAGESNTRFFSISGSDFVEMFVGVGASRVRDLFDTAKASAPAVVFIDEIDAVGRQRGAGLGGGHDEREQTLNQLLVEMDGFIHNQGIIVLAATNRADILDPALLRPGRFDRQIHVGYPDIKGREEILKVHAKNKPFEGDKDTALKTVARRTTYFTGADLENLLNEAAILAARRDRENISLSELEEAATRVQMGPEKKSRVITDEDRRVTAYHEAGHAVLALKLEKMDGLHEVSIIARGEAAGYTMTLPEDDWMHMTKQRMLNRICMTMGGRVAEKLIFGDVSTGAVQDLKHSSETARNMVEKFGMSDEIGPVFLGSDTEVFIAKDWGHSKNYSEAVAARVDAEIKRILTEQFDRAEHILAEHMDTLRRGAEALLLHERMTGEEFVAALA